MSFIRSGQSVNSWNTTTAMATTGPSTWKYSWTTQSSTTTTSKAGSTIVNAAITGTTGAAAAFYWSTASDRCQYGHLYYTSQQVLVASGDESIANGISYTINGVGTKCDTTVSRVHIWRLL